MNWIVTMNKCTGPAIGDRWIEWRGGSCPLAPGTQFEAQHRGGHVTKNRVAYANDRWEHLGTECDIVAYRVMQKGA